MRIFLMAMLVALGAQAMAAGITLPTGAKVMAKPDEADNAWREFGTLPLAYTAARSSFDLALRKQGWRKLNSIEYDRVRWKALEVWVRSGEKILLQFWREEVGLTGFSWGIWKEDGKI